jgi:4-hydroxybenzoate polyprenyltransferase
LKYWILYGNLWVSAGAASMAYATSLMHHTPVKLSFILMVFFACLFVYNFHRVFRVGHIYGSKSSFRHHWIIENQKSIRALTLLSGVLAFILAIPSLSPSLLLTTLPFLLLVILYVMPLYQKDGQWKRLRDIPFLKIFLIATVWAFVTVQVPLAVSQPDSYMSAGFWLSFSQRFLFIFAITLPFDIRDLAHDRQFGVKTFASVLGVNRLKNLSHLLLIATLLVVYTGMQQGLYSMYHAAGMLVSIVGTGWLISRVNETSSEFYYTALLDGTMIDQLFWIWLFGQFA